VFVTPLQGDREIRAASQSGFNVTQSLHSIRIMGQDKAGIVAELTKRLPKGHQPARIGGDRDRSQFVAYVDGLARRHQQGDRYPRQGIGEPSKTAREARSRVPASRAGGRITIPALDVWGL